MGPSVTGAGGLCPALSGHAPLRFGELEGGIATSAKDAGSGVGVSHGLLLGRFVGNIPKPPHTSSLECEVTPQPLSTITFWTRLPLLGQDKGAGRGMGVQVLSAKK